MPRNLHFPSLLTAIAISIGSTGIIPLFFRRPHGVWAFSFQPTSFHSHQSPTGTKRARHGLAEHLPVAPCYKNQNQSHQASHHNRPARRDTIWKSKYNQLYQFYQQHGHTNLPPTFEYKDLKAWMTYQRVRYRHSKDRGEGGHEDDDDDDDDTGPRGSPPHVAPLTKEQMQLLKDVQFSWTPQDEIWWANFQQLELHYQLHGHFHIQDKENSKLRQWKNSLRRLCREYVLAVTLEGTTDGVHVSGLNEERLQALRRFQFCWLPPPPSSSPSKTTTTAAASTTTTTISVPSSEKLQRNMTRPPPEDIFPGYHGPRRNSR